MLVSYGFDITLFNPSGDPNASIAITSQEEICRSWLFLKQACRDLIILFRPQNVLKTISR